MSGNFKIVFSSNLYSQYAVFLFDRSNNALVKVTYLQAIKEFWFVSKFIWISSFQWINFKIFKNPFYWFICESAWIYYSVKLFSCESRIKHLKSSWKSHVSSLVNLFIYSFRIFLFDLIYSAIFYIISRCAWLFQCNFCIQDNGRSLKLWLGIWLEDLQESVLI